MEEWNVSQRIRLTGAECMLAFSAGKTGVKNAAAQETGFPKSR